MYATLCLLCISGKCLLLHSCNLQPIVDLPKVPRNVHFEYHPNECYDWGTMGWVLERKIVDVNQYTYFFFMNASVRGPFFPPYLWVCLTLHSTSVLPHISLAIRPDPERKSLMYLQD